MSKRDYNKISTEKAKEIAEESVDTKNNMESEVAKESKPVVKRNGVVSCPLLNVRSKASTDSDVVTVIAEGTEVVIRSEKDGWFAVTLEDGKKGFVLADFIEED